MKRRDFFLSLVFACTTAIAAHAVQIDNRFIKDKTITAVKIHSESASSGEVLTADGAGNASFQPASSGGGRQVKWSLTSAVIPFIDIDGPHYVDSSSTLSAVFISMLNSGSSGSTTIRVNQYRAGALFDSETASLSASSGAPAAAQVSLSGSLSLQSGDILSCDVVSVSGGSPESLSVEY